MVAHSALDVSRQYFFVVSEEWKVFVGHSCVGDEIGSGSAAHPRYRAVVAGEAIEGLER